MSEYARTWPQLKHDFQIAVFLTLISGNHM